MDIFPHDKTSHILLEAIEPFITAKSSSRLAFLVGAGISRNPPANRPLAGELIWSMADAFWDLSQIARSHWKKTTVCKRSNRVRFESLMQIVADTTGSVGFLRVLRGGKPNALHRMLAKALMDGCPVVTTNFDMLIERAVTQKNKLSILKKTVDFRKWGRRSSRGVLAKFHGSLEDLDSLCATIQQIGLLGPAFMWDPPRGEYLSMIRKKYPMMVIGYSGYDDSDILPRLRITESDLPLLWVLHSRRPLKIATPKDIKRLAKAPGLSDFLLQSNATVLTGDTHEACILIDKKMKKPSFSSSSKHAESLPSKILFYMRRTAAPYIADFLIARMFFEGGYKSSSRKLFQLVRRNLNGRHPGLAVRCITNEATVATGMGDWLKAGRVLDEALPGLKRWADEKAFINACINRAIVYRHTGQSTLGEESLRNLMNLLKSASEFRFEYARCLVNLADFMFERENFNEATRLLKRSRIEYKKVGDHCGMGMVFGVYGKIFFAQNKIEEAMNQLQMALWHYEVGWDDAGKAKILNNLGTMQRCAGLIEEAILSFEKSKHIGIRINDPEIGVVSEMGMTIVDLALGKLSSAMQRAQKCLPKATKLGLIDMVLQTRGNLGLALMNSNRIDEALRIFNDILPQLKTNGPEIHVPFTLRNIGECHRKLRNTLEAEENLKAAERLYLVLNKKEEAEEVKSLIAANP
jgi:tetratricopeptide (TPR) repeat protein